MKIWCLFCGILIAGLSGCGQQISSLNPLAPAPVAPPVNCPARLSFENPATALQYWAIQTWTTGLGTSVALDSTHTDCGNYAMMLSGNYSGTPPSAMNGYIQYVFATPIDASGLTLSYWIYVEKPTPSGPTGIQLAGAFLDSSLGSLNGLTSWQTLPPGFQGWKHFTTAYSGSHPNMHGLLIAINELAPAVQYSTRFWIDDINW